MPAPVAGAAATQPQGAAPVVSHGQTIYGQVMSQPGPDGAIGRTRALTVLSPLPRFWTLPLRGLLRIKRRQGPDPVLQRLSFIHVAHWVVLSSFPGQPRDRRSRYTYLLFVSNFNGSWRDYIDAFSTAIPGRMALLWGSSYGFPGATPPRPFVAYIERNQLAPDHFYAAYPEASATEVASALRVHRRFTDQVEPVADDAALDDAGFEAAWTAFLTDAQRDL